MNTSNQKFAKRWLNNRTNHLKFPRSVVGTCTEKPACASKVQTLSKLRALPRRHSRPRCTQERGRCRSRALVPPCTSPVSRRLDGGAAGRRGPPTSSCGDSSGGPVTMPSTTERIADEPTSSRRRAACSATSSEDSTSTPIVSPRICKMTGEHVGMLTASRSAIQTILQAEKHRLKRR